MATIGGHTLVRWIAAYRLPGAVLDPRPQDPLPEESWRAMAGAVRAERLTGLLSTAILAGDFPATAEQAEAAHDAHVDEMARVLQLEIALLEIADLLDQHSFEYRVLKGSAVASLDYPDPSLRSFIDNDVLVRSSDWDAAAAALQAAGNRRLYGEPRRGFDRRFSKGTTLRTTRGDEIDLHRTFVLGPFGLAVDLDDVWSEHQLFRCGPRELPALGRAHRFLHACYHAALGDVPPRLVPLRDVAEMALGSAEPIDVDAVLSRAERWSAEIVVARAVNLAWETFGLGDVTALSTWARLHQPSVRQERALDTYLNRQGDRYVRMTRHAVRWVPGVRNKATYLLSLAFPDARYTRARGGRIRRLRRTVGTGRPRSRHGGGPSSG